MATGQWLTPADDARFFFDSGALSLDFAHSSAQDAQELHDWLADRFESLSPDTTDRDQVDAGGLRAAILRLARASADTAAPDPDDIDTVNLFAATPDVPPSLDGGRRQAGRTRVRTGQALATIARDAVTLFEQNTDGRIRECAADDCHLIFFDESRTNNRRWCSMQRCGNRAKIRAFRAKGTGE